MWTNSIGAFAGALVASAGLYWDTARGGRDAAVLISGSQVRRSLIGFAAGIAAIGLTGALSSQSTAAPSSHTLLLDAVTGAVSTTNPDSPELG